MTAMNISPLKSAYADAKSLAPVLASGFTGPIPPKIIDAFSRESTQSKPATQWYPAIPMSKATKTNKVEIAIHPANLLMKTETGASFSCLRSNMERPHVSDYRIRANCCVWRA